MQLIGISYRIPDIPDRQFCEFQQFCRLCHPIGNQKFLRGFPQRISENLAEITQVQPALGCNVLYGNIILKVLFNKA